MKFFSKLAAKSGLSIAKKVSVALVMVVAMVSAAHAGTGGTEFDPVWTTIKDWTEGSLGKVIAGSFVLIGLVGGIARGSLMALALGVASGVGLANAPALIDSIMIATLPVIG